MLRIDLQKFSREKAQATYSSFFVDNEANKYKLKLGTFNGTNGMGMAFFLFTYTSKNVIKIYFTYTINAIKHSRVIYFLKLSLGNKSVSYEHDLS